MCLCNLIAILNIVNRNITISCVSLKCYLSAQPKIFFIGLLLGKLGLSLHRGLPSIWAHKMFIELSRKHGLVIGTS